MGCPSSSYTRRTTHQPEEPNMGSTSRQKTFNVAHCSLHQEGVCSFPPAGCDVSTTPRRCVVMSFALTCFLLSNTSILYTKWQAEAYRHVVSLCVWVFWGEGILTRIIKHYCLLQRRVHLPMRVFLIYGRTTRGHLYSTVCYAIYITTMCVSAASVSHLRLTWF